MSTEIWQPVQSYRVTRQCECGGEMLCGSTALLTWPAQYPHICSQCSRQESFAVSYPTIEYRATTDGDAR